MRNIEIQDRTLRHAGWCCIALCVALSLQVLAAPPAQHADTHPNVIFVLIDTLRADRIHAQRGGVAVMPKLRATAARGWHFTNACAPSSWTKPSLVSMFTGLYPQTHGITAGMKLRLESKDDMPTLDGPSPGLELAAEYFKRHGYATVGVQTNRLLRAGDGFARGFDAYIEPKFTNAESVNETVFDAMGKAAAPFFLYVHYMDPHSPYNPPKPHREVFGPLPQLSEDDAKIFAKASAYSDYYMDRILFGLGRIAQRRFAALGESGREYARMLYDGDCHYVDDQMAGMVERLLRQWPDSVVIITADHGEELWEHGDIGHGRTLYQELVQVPLVILAPGAMPREIGTPVESVDLLPTIAELAQLPANPAWQGRSLVPEEIPPRPVFSATDGTFSDAKVSLETIIDGDKKLIRAREGAVQLFGLKADPRERHDLSAEAPELRARLTAQLDAHNATCAAHPLAKLAPTRTALDEATVEKLRALGYADSPK